MSSEPDSFDEFFRRHFGLVVGFLMKMGFDFDEARDASAEAMLRAHEAWPALVRPRPWIYTTAQRIAVKKARRDRDGVERAIRGGWVAPQLIDPFVVVDGYAEVLTVLSVLTETQRLVMAWCLHEFTASEIGEQLGMKEATVRSHLRDARARLRPHFEAARPARRAARGPGTRFEAEGGDR